MLPLPSLAAFFAAALLLALAPGPDNLFVLAQSALHGARKGIAVTLGLCTGLLVHTALVALGIAALLHAVPGAFLLVRLFGAGYLLVLAWQALRVPVTAADADGEAMPLLRYYRRGIIMNITNPKVALFFLAFLPPFTDPQRGSVPLQVMLLGALFIAAALIVFGTLCLGAATIGVHLRRHPRLQQLLNRAAGTLYLLLAAHLAVSATDGGEIMERYLPLLALPAFLLLWCGVLFLLARLGGWTELAQRYATELPFPDGCRYFVSAQFRALTRYGGCLIAGADAQGIYLKPWLLFRPFHPPLHIPWAEIAVTDEQQWLWRCVRFTFPGVPGAYCRFRAATAAFLLRQRTAGPVSVDPGGGIR